MVSTKQENKRRTLFNWRGIFSFLVSNILWQNEVQKVLFIVSCSWKNAKKIDESIKKQFPKAEISYVIRKPFPTIYREKKKYISTVAVTLRSKIELIKELRRERFDLVVSAWTGERGFLALKLLSYLIAARSSMVFNESIDCFWLVMKNCRRLGQILLHKTLHPRTYILSRPLLNWLSLIFLTPFGMLYVSVRVLYYTFKKYFLILFRNHRLLS